MPQIQPVDIVAPGAFGLNTEKGETLLRPQWATTARNAVINHAGRIGSRKGWASLTGAAIAGTPTIDVVFEQLSTANETTIISAATNKIFKGVSDFTIGANDITSATVPTADHWKFVNFNGKALGYQRDHTPIVRSSGDFADIVLSDPDFGPDGGNDAVAAFGRVWVVDKDKQTIWYSALLDETDFTTENGGGFLTMTKVWTTGIDEIVAIRAIGATLVVFGKNHIIMWADQQGTELGLDPLSLEVVDTVEGTGCIARDSIAATGEGDLIFLSRHGLQSLGRVIQEKSNPIVSLTKNVRTVMLEAIKSQQTTDPDMDQVRSIHNPEEGLYIINFPVYGKMFALDTQHTFQDDEGEPAVPVLLWDVGGSVVGLASRRNGDIYFGSGIGEIGKYSGNDDNTSSFEFEFWTGWLDFEQLNHRLKMLKEIVAVVSAGAGDINFVWEWDFSNTTNTRTVAYSTIAAAEFNDLPSGAEFNLGEFSGGLRVSRVTVAAFGEGQFIRVGATATIDGFGIIIQQLSLSPKIGRMVT